MDKIYKAEYEDGEFEIITSDNDTSAMPEAESYEDEHGILFNLFEVNADYEEIRTVFQKGRLMIMARYKMTINTDTYKCGRCSKKNWEPGTRNDYMIAINGITRTLYNMREVMWQLELFHGNSFVMSEYSDDNPEENYGLSDRYIKFLKKNTIKYHDRLCNLDRQQYLSGYGWMQGYFSIGEVMEKLKKEGTVKVPFSWLYDIRQYDKAMNGCYMEITKI